MVLAGLLDFPELACNKIYYVPLLVLVASEHRIAVFVAIQTFIGLSNNDTLIYLLFYAAKYPDYEHAADWFFGRRMLWRVAPDLREQLIETILENGSIFIYHWCRRHMALGKEFYTVAQQRLNNGKFKYPQQRLLLGRLVAEELDIGHARRLKKESRGVTALVMYISELVSNLAFPQDVEAALEAMYPKLRLDDSKDGRMLTSVMATVCIRAKNYEVFDWLMCMTHLDHSEKQFAARYEMETHGTAVYARRFEDELAWHPELISTSFVSLCQFGNLVDAQWVQGKSKLCMKPEAARRLAEECPQETAAWLFSTFIPCEDGDGTTSRRPLPPTQAYTPQQLGYTVSPLS